MSDQARDEADPGHGLSLQTLPSYPRPRTYGSSRGPVSSLSHRTKPTLSGWQSRQLVIPPIKTYPGGADRRLLAPVYGFSAAAGFAAAEIAILFSSVSNSMGSGKTMVVFFSTPISVSVCR